MLPGSQTIAGLYLQLVSISMRMESVYSKCIFWNRNRFTRLTKTHDNREARLRELLASPILNPAIRRPLQFGAKKDVKVLEGFEPFPVTFILVKFQAKNSSLLRDPDPHEVLDAFLVTVLLDLQDELCEETGWGIQMNQVYGIPGDPFSWMASLRGDYSGTDIPEPHIRRLREVLGAEGPPMWYLSQGKDGQWDTKGPFTSFDPESLLRALEYRD
ncbi:hypothetical protein E4T56_gene4649 [Termitomyces sp. T112]|nr:hypothetical protein E4T56_gene4649 [Termitomyces sp. T112]